MSASLKKQDLPPSGGYSPINYKRIAPKSYFNGYSLIAIYVGVTATALSLYAKTFYKRKREEVEMRSARLAMLPLLIAEKDRAFLKQLRKNRDAEDELMKNVEGWETGTLYGEPIYRSIPEDYVFMPTDGEFYAHTSRSEWWKRMRHYLYKIVNDIIEEDNKRLSENELKKIERELWHDNQAMKSVSLMKECYPLYEVGTSLYAEKCHWPNTQPFRKRTSFSKPIEEQYGAKFKPE